MQLIEFFAVRADTGSALPSPTVSVFLTGTSAPASLYDAAGDGLANPFTGGAGGLVSFSAPDGVYDVQVQAGGYTAPKITGLQVVDLAALAAGVPVNVKALGAVCDGVHDDTPALEAAIALVGARLNSSNAQGGGIIRVPRGGIARITRPLYLDPFVVIEGELGSGGFFQNFTPGEVTGSGIFADFDFTSGGAVEAVGLVAATGLRIAPTTYVTGSQVDAGTYTHLTGCGLRNLFVYTNHANAFAPVRFIGAPQFVLDNVACQGFWHGPVINASWAGRIPALFSRNLYSGLILDQDCNGIQLGALYLSGDLVADVTTQTPAACAFPNWDTYGLTPADPNVQPANANLQRTGLVVMSGNPASAGVVIAEGWNVAVNVHASGLSCNVLECENISDWAATVYGSRLTVDNLFAYTPGKNLLYAAQGSDTRIGVPEWVRTFFTAPVQYWSSYANSFVVEGQRVAAYPWANGVVTYRDAEDSLYNDVYIDAVAGNDAGLGFDASAPLLTLNQALLRLRPDKLNRIFLQQGQTHATGAATVIQTLTITDCRLELHGYTPASGVLTRPVLSASVDQGNVHTNGLILTRSSLLFQDVDFAIRMCTGNPEGYNAGLYIQGTCDVRFAGASVVQVESGNATVGVFQPWYGRSGALTWSLEDTASIAQFPGSAAAGCLGVSAYAGMGRLSVIGAIESSASPAVEAAIHANGYAGASYGALVSQA
ncbi:MAG: hypothetical protein ACYDD1_11785 [Caulobacteraceae bacterium]